MALPISTNSVNASQPNINTQQSLERTRQESQVDVTANQNSQPVAQEDQSTTAQPIEASNNSERAENRESRPAVEPSEPQEQANAEETIGGQIDVRA